MEGPAQDLAEILPGGKMRLHFHPGQWRAWNSTKRFTLVLAGRQSGKTSFGPYWLLREIQRRGPGDYLVVAPTFQLLNKKALPEFLRLFKRRLRLGDYRAGDHTFAFSPDGQRRTHGAASDEDTKVFFGHAANPESLESATAKACWADEAGQKTFRIGSWEAIQGRLSLNRGPCLLTTTPYDLGWLKQALFDPWERAQGLGGHPDVEVVRFDSTENPRFSREEFDRLARSMPRWRFDLFYRAIFSRPAGLIYDRFIPTAGPGGHVVPTFRIPQHWNRYLGMDFGAVNTAAVFLAEELTQHNVPTGRLIAYREYHPGKLDPKEHAANLLAGEPRTPVAIGGAASEDEWRERFGREGLPIGAPSIREVEVGIDCVYTTTSRSQLVVMEHCEHLIDEFKSYSRVLDDMGNPTDGIEAKETYHLLDALRYVVSWLRPGESSYGTPTDNPDARSILEDAPEGLFFS